VNSQEQNAGSFAMMYSPLPTPPDRAGASYAH